MVKKLYLLVLLLITLMKLEMITSIKILEIPKADIIHTASELVLHYISDYQPSNKVVTFIASFPMVEDMCFLIPLSAMKKIPECKGLYLKTGGIQFNVNSSSTQNKLKCAVKKPRFKRWIVQLISIAVGVASFIFGTANTIQSISLKK